MFVAINEFNASGFEAMAKAAKAEGQEEKKEGSGWVLRGVQTDDDLIEALWEAETGEQFIADYRPDGTSKWIYKGSEPDFPSETPPAVPTTFNGEEIKFETPENDAGKITEKKSDEKKPAVKETAKKTKERKTAQPREKKGKEDTARKIGETGLSVGIGILTSPSGHDSGRGVDKHHGGGSRHPGEGGRPHGGGIGGGVDLQ